VPHDKAHGLFGLALPSRCPISKKIIKIGLFFAYLEPRHFTGFLNINTKKEGENLDSIKIFAFFKVLYIPTKYTIFHSAEETRNQFGSNPTRVRIPPSPYNVKKCEPDPNFYSRGSVRVCFWLIYVIIVDVISSVL